jgi:hypothetical protein
VNFGKYLVGKSIMQERDLARALLIQKTDRVPLGQLAVQKGFIDNKLTCFPELGPVFRGRLKI